MSSICTNPIHPITFQEQISNSLFAVLTSWPTAKRLMKEGGMLFLLWSQQHKMLLNRRSHIPLVQMPILGAISPWSKGHLTQHPLGWKQKKDKPVRKNSFGKDYLRVESLITPSSFFRLKGCMALSNRFSSALMILFVAALHLSCFCSA